jgi:predicted Rdx family selenoprotein
MAINALLKQHSPVATEPVRDDVAGDRPRAAWLETLEVVGAVKDDVGAVTLEEVLETVGEFGMASQDLVAWEFAVDGSELATVWDQAVGEGLLRPVKGRDETGEQMYVLAAPGASLVRASAHRPSASR